MIESGLVHRWKKMYYPRDQCSLQNQGDNGEPASLSDVQGAFILFGAMLSLALLQFLYEYMNNTLIKT